MSKPSKEISVTVERPKKGEIVKFTTVANLAPVDQIVTAIRADHQLFQSHSKMAAYLALRIGLRLVWVKGNSGHGSLEPFIQEHFKDFSRSTVTNYIRIANAFVSELELSDKKTHKLTDASKIAPILEQQLELFTDPNAKLDIHCKQLVAWVNERGLSQIYKDLSEEEAALPPQGHQGKKKTVKKTPEQTAREEFQSSLSLFKADFTDNKWQHLSTAEREKLDTWLTASAQIVREHNKQVNKTTTTSKKK